MQAVLCPRQLRNNFGASLKKGGGKFKMNLNFLWVLAYLFTGRFIFKKVKILLNSVYLIYQVASGHGNVKKKICCISTVNEYEPGRGVKGGRGIAKTFFHRNCTVLPA